MRPEITDDLLSAAAERPPLAVDIGAPAPVMKETGVDYPPRPSRPRRGVCTAPVFGDRFMSSIAPQCGA